MFDKKAYDRAYRAAEYADNTFREYKIERQLQWHRNDRERILERMRVYNCTHKDRQTAILEEMRE